MHRARGLRAHLTPAAMTNTGVAVSLSSPSTLDALSAIRRAMDQLTLDRTARRTAAPPNAA
eukprot:11185553-Lingulodinium_polyedra.AAC.1